MPNETSKQATLLIIDDEIDVLKSLKDTLSSEGFYVVTAETGKKGIDKAKQSNPDLILLDLRLPDIDGYDVCRELRKERLTAAIPIIMVSTRSKDTEKIVGLEIGADDYVAKPYNIGELLARIRAVLRRQTKSLQQEDTPGGIIKQGKVSVDLEKRRVSVGDKAVELTRKEFELLVLLLSKPGKVFTRSHLLEAIWGPDFDSLHGTVNTHIKTLRQKLGPAGDSIETVTGMGYRWAESEE